MKRLLSGVVAFSVLLSLVSCANEPKIINQDTVSTLRFSWWGKDDRNKYILDGIDIFENQNTNISINPEYSDFDGLKTRMDVEIYSNTQADVMQLNYSWLDEYARQDNALYNIYELSEYVDISKFSEEVLSYGSKDGKLYGIPVSLDAVTFYYNKTLYDSYGLELPETWEDLFRAADVMKSDEVYPLSLNELSCWICCAAYAEQVTGIAMYDENGKFQYTSEELKLMLDFYVSLVKQKVIKPVSEFSRRDFQNCITGGIAVWISEGSYYYSSISNEGYNIKVGDYPIMESSKAFGWYYKPSAFYSIKKTTEYPEAAASLLNYLINSEEMALNQGTSIGVPLSAAAVETLEARDMLKGLSVDANEKIEEHSQSSQINTIKLMNPNLENQEIARLFSTASDSLYHQKINSQMASVNLYNEIIEYLSGK